MSLPAMGKRMAATIDRNRAYWTDDQLACYYAACAATGTVPGPVSAEAWRCGKGAAAEYWRGLTGGERKRVKRAWREANGGS